MPETKTEKRPTPKDWDTLNDNVKRANDGDQKALNWLRSFLDNNPQVWSNLGDLAQVAETAWIKMISNGDKLTSECIRRQLAQLKEELIADSPSRVEKMVSDQVVATWLEVHFLQTKSADSPGKTAMQTATLLKRVDSAQKRHLNTLRNLLLIRKLIPAGNSIPHLRIFDGERAAS